MGEGEGEGGVKAQVHTKVDRADEKEGEGEGEREGEGKGEAVVEMEVDRGEEGGKDASGQIAGEEGGNSFVLGEGDDMGEGEGEGGVKAQVDTKVDRADEREGEGEGEDKGKAVVEMVVDRGAEKEDRKGDSIVVVRVEAVGKEEVDQNKAGSGLGLGLGLIKDEQNDDQIALNKPDDAMEVDAQGQSMTGVINKANRGELSVQPPTPDDPLKSSSSISLGRVEFEGILRMHANFVIRCMHMHYSQMFTCACNYC